MSAGIRGIRDVAERNLCTGCGACAFVQPDVITMVDDLDQGRRPLVLLDSGVEPDTREALSVCPGAALRHPVAPARLAPDGHPELASAWGPVLEVWEGYASDREVRHAASSGGATTALALHCLQDHGMHGVLHIAARQDIPYLNRTVLSRTREELLSATGSRYAPASPCDGLGRVEAAPAPCVFVGKPCDVAAAAKARAQRPALDAKLGVTIAFFCAGTPSTRGTLEMAETLGVAPEDIASVRYRGRGWPGRARVRRRGGNEERTLSYEESWGAILQRHRQWRCRVCVDHTGEFADISVGDPWYRGIPDDEPGHSLIIARTERGRRLLHAAVASGTLLAERVDPGVIGASQPNLLSARASVWGRLVASRLTGVATPRYRNLPTFRWWWRELSWWEKAQSTLGTLRRVRQRGLRRRRVVTPMTSPEPPAMTGRRYVLVTPARNEASGIAATLESVLAQHERPVRWVVVSDGSTDGTDAIVAAYAARHPFIHLLRRESDDHAGFASKVAAFADGYQLASRVDHDFVGNLDADVEVPPGYFSRLLDVFSSDPRLGLSGGQIHARLQGGVQVQRVSANSVAGAAALYRRDCFAQVGGFLPLPLGGEDSAAEILARYHGWRVEHVPELEVRHHGAVTHGTGSLLAARFRKGRTNRLLGYDPGFHVAVSAFRALEPPYVAGGAAMALGYLWSAVRLQPTVLPDPVVRFLRAEQRRRLTAIASGRAGALEQPPPSPRAAA